MGLFFPDCPPDPVKFQRLRQQQLCRAVCHINIVSGFFLHFVRERYTTVYAWTQ